MYGMVLFTVDTHLSYLLKYDNRYFFCSRYFWFLVFARQPNKYTVENRCKPTRRRFVPEKMTKCHKLIQIGSKPVTLDSHTFTSMSVLGTVLREKMLIVGLVFVELFEDINILSCYNQNLVPGNASSLITWDKATKDMSLKGYAPAARKAVRSFHEVVSSLYTDGKEAIAGQKIAAFKSKGEWIGEDGRDG